MKRDSDRQIWKFPLRVADEQTIEMPAGACVLCVQVQNGQPCLWASVRVSAPKEPITFCVVGTGHPMPVDADIRYVGTFQLDGGTFVFHVWEKA